jgi:hypothetical protein
LPVVMVAPPSARRTLYQEHAADWVLPAVFSVPAGTMSALVATQIQRWLGRPGDEEEPAPTVRFRRAVISGDNVELLEIEGPADEVIAVLNAEAGPQPNSGWQPQGD